MYVLKKSFNNNVVATVLGVVATVLGGVILAGLGFIWNLYTRQNGIDVELGKIKQRLADGGTHEIVSQLNDATKSQDIAATMTLIAAQVHVSSLLVKSQTSQKSKSCRLRSFRPPNGLRTLRKHGLPPHLWQHLELPL